MPRRVRIHESLVANSTPIEQPESDAPDILGHPHEPSDPIDAEELPDGEILWGAPNVPEGVMLAALRKIKRRGQAREQKRRMRAEGGDTYLEGKPISERQAALKLVVIDGRYELR